MIYLVKAGDTLSKIANKYGVSLESLKRANSAIKNVNSIKVGQQIQIPKVEPRPPIDLASLLKPTDKDEKICKIGDSTVALPWGKKVSAEFKQKVSKIAGDLETLPEYLMACMAFESGETFSPSIENGAGSGAVGLIQFMPDTATSLGTSSESLKLMTAEEQLDYVAKYFKSYKGKLTTLDDVYMVILWPKAVGKASDYVLFDGTAATEAEQKEAAADKKKAKALKARLKRYSQNSGLDSNTDSKVTKSEAGAMVREKLKRGSLPQFLG